MRQEYEALLARCAEHRGTEVGKLYCRLLELDAERRLRLLETADERNFREVQGGVRAIRELRSRIG